MTTALRAVGYTRISKEDRRKDARGVYYVKPGISLDNQDAKIRAYCALKDFECIEVVSDPGLSAKNLNRPGLQRILEMAKRKEFDALVVYNLDRLSRDTIDAITTVRDLEKNGVSFHSAMETFETYTADGEFMFTIFCALAQRERRRTSERTRDNLRHKRANGGKTGGECPFGWNVKDGQLTENPQEQATIRSILDMRPHYSCQAIAEYLDDQGIKTKTGNTGWHRSTVAGILKREREGKWIENSGST